MSATTQSLQEEAQMYVTNCIDLMYNCDDCYSSYLKELKKCQWIVGIVTLFENGVSQERIDAEFMIERMMNAAECATKVAEWHSRHLSQKWLSEVENALMLVDSQYALKENKHVDYYTSDDQDDNDLDRYEYHNVLNS